MRDAISLLDQLASMGTKITLALAQTVLGTATSQTVLDIVASILDREPARGLETIHRSLDSGADARSLARQIVEYLRGLMLIQMGNIAQVEATRDVKAQMETHAKSFSASDVLRMMKAFNVAATDLRGGWQPSLGLELALAEAFETPEVLIPQSAAATSPQPAPAKQTESAAKSAPKEIIPEKKPVIGSGEVVKFWKQIVAALPKSQANLAALLNSVKMIDVQGDTLLLGFASDVLVDKMNKPDQIAATQKAIADALGVKVNIRCAVTNAKGKIPPNVSQDGMVATAIQHGGEVVE
jgi:DNA polymerase-3 subunit gamma/tau